MISVLDELIKLDTEEFSASNKPRRPRRKTAIVILRREVLDLLLNYDYEQKQLPYCAAKLIDYCLHWHKWKIANHRTPWFYQPVKHIYEDFMQEHSRHVIREAINLLMQFGYLERRGNPGNGQDRTYQYRLRIKRLIAGLEELKRLAPPPSEDDEDDYDEDIDIHASVDINNVRDLTVTQVVNDVDTLYDPDVINDVPMLNNMNDHDIDQLDDIDDGGERFSDIFDAFDTSSPEFSSSETYTQSPFVRSEQAGFKNESAKFNVEQYPKHLSIDIRSKSIDKKIDKKIDDDDFEKKASQGNGEALNYTVEIPTYTNGLITSLPITGENQISATEPTNLEVKNHVEQKKVKDKPQGFVPTTKNNPSVTPRRLPEPCFLYVEGVDEETHKILWQHQAELTRLNVDLDAKRVQKAIVYNPQNLENAIFAFFEASAKRTLTKEAATGYLYNALRNGWKPKYSKTPTAQKPQYFTAPPEFFEKPPTPTLAELVERKRQVWKVALLRPFIETWAKVTPGVMLTSSGPVVEPGY